MYSKIHLQLLLSVIIKLAYSTKITIYHASDYGGIFEELTNKNYGQLVGGLARVKDYLRDENAKFIFTGNFIRKPYDEGKARLKIEIALLEYLRPEVVVLGNNEYSMSSQNLEWFLRNSDFPIVSTNIEFKTVTRQIEQVRQLDKDIQVLSYNVKSTANLKSAADLTVKDPVLALNTQSFENGQNFTIAAGCAGMEEIRDMIVATENIRLFITGCSKSVFQWQSHQPFPPEYIPNITNDYPIEILNYKDRKVLVAHSYGSTKFLGRMELETDDVGNLINHKSEMLYLSRKIYGNPNIDSLLEPLRLLEIATSRVFLNGKCGASECNLGNLITDAFIQYKVDTFNEDEFWTDVSIALMPAGNINASIDTTTTDGYITMDHLSKVFPKKQNLVTVKMQGDELHKSIQMALSDAGRRETNKFLQVSGLKIQYDARKASKHRLAIRVRCARCKVPSYSSLKPSHTYKIISTDNLVAGAFGHYILGNSSKVKKKEIITDLDAVIKYIRLLKSIRTSRSDRIIMVHKDLAESLGILLKSVHVTILGMMCVYYLLTNKWT